MKPKNFPARKLMRQLKAEYRKTGTYPSDDTALEAARSIRTKKNRSNA